jgi:hypothetical protein
MCPRALNHSRLRNGNVDETAHNQPAEADQAKCLLWVDTVEKGLVIFGEQ